VDQGGGVSVAWGDVTGKPSTFPPSAHTHVIADVTGLQYNPYILLGVISVS